MSNNAQEILDTIITKLKTLASTETVVGAPVSLGAVSVLPVVKLTVGFAAGGGEGSADSGKGGKGVGGAGGGGAVVTPIGFIVWDGEKVQFIGLGKGAIETLVESVPELLAKLGLTKKDKKTAGAGNPAAAGDDSAS
jgi:uncharacterized spore protein YtfJ